MEKSEVNFLREDYEVPLINLAEVRRESPTVLELVTAVRKEATERYPQDINKKCELVIDDVRHSLSIVLRDLNGRFVLVNRKSIGDNPLANKNNTKEELAKLVGKDFPLASRGILPDSSFKLDDKLDNTVIKSLQYIGTTIEKPGELEAKGDADTVRMPCYIADVFSKFKELGESDKWDILSAAGVLNLEPEQCTLKVMVLRDHLEGKDK